ncbi:ferrous iron transport protein B [Oleisolibacter albus]|uniref:ferrous iron transport protein B n=1 Tax=Oleisolibacter albus TaxID=2171757 RepID=UPI003B82E57B
MSAPAIALVGCPNCGKTALFNALTGSRQKVANYAGVTVERKEGSFRTPAGRPVRVLDLPGTYSLRARSPDEEVTRDVVLGRRGGETAPDILVCVADATNLRLVLRLVLELKSVGTPLVLALNMMDIAKRQGVEINVERLSAELGVPVVPSVAVRRGGTQALLQEIDKLCLGGETLRGSNSWHPLEAGELRALHREAERILKACSFRPADNTLTGRIDRVLLHPVLGTAVLLLILFLMFQAVFAWAEPVMDLIEGSIGDLGALIGGLLPDGLLRSLLVDGIIAGVGSVLVFLPQILILFFFIILLEDFGYMARAAFLMDKIMGGAGLHGRAFIPLLSSFACAIPGVMATRVIDSKRDRLATILVAPLTTCSARIPVYTLIIAAFVPNTTVWGGFGLQGLTMFGLYATGILAALLVAAVLKRLVWREQPEPFLMELPSYKRPSLRNVALGLWQRGTIFLKRAGTIILTLSIVVWFLCTFPAPPADATAPAIDYAFAGMIGHWLEPVLAPIGFNWQIAIALVPGLAAREVMVSALGTIYAVAETGDAAAGALEPLLAAQWSLPTALALLAWYVFAPQCIATLAVVKRETNSWRWPTILFLYMLVLAYTASYAVFHISSALLG